ncbi:MAG: L,D-transpeptidase family protein [Sphingomicrobium sp.]
MNHLRNFRPGVRPMISARKAAVAAVGLAVVALAGSTPAAARATQPLYAAPVSPAAIADFYRARGGSPLWFAPGAGNAAPQLLQQLATAQADNLNPKRYRLSALAKAVRAAETRDPVAVQRAEMMLSEAFVNYARDLRHDPNAGIIYVDPELRPTPLSPRTLLDQAAAAGSLSAYVSKMGWMSPVYAQLRQALASRMYLNERQRQLLAVNLERARALPSGNQRYVVVNPAAQRLYMYENGQVVDYMRVVAGRPDPIAQTPMMSAFIRYIALNPYWNSPPDITARRLAPKVVKGGRAYLNEKGYEVLSDWGDHPKVIDPMSINWKAVVAGQVQVRMRQKPGPANSMGRMKFMFPNKQGIWLHDTPEKEVLEEAARLQSNGCVRLEDAPRFARWLYGRNLKAQGARPEQKVPLASPVAVYITYLTAVPSGSSIVYFDDVYGLDSRPRRVASR